MELGARKRLGRSPNFSLEIIFSAARLLSIHQRRSRAFEWISQVDRNPQPAFSRIYATQLVSRCLRHVIRYGAVWRLIRDVRNRYSLHDRGGRALPWKRVGLSNSPFYVYRARTRAIVLLKCAPRSDALHAAAHFDAQLPQRRAGARAVNFNSGHETTCATHLPAHEVVATAGKAAFVDGRHPTLRFGKPCVAYSGAGLHVTGGKHPPPALTHMHTVIR